jgi:hypothetical protein
VAHFHSIKRSARNRSVCGIDRPRTLAAFWLRISSNRVGRYTGRSPGFAPLSILST